MMCDQEQISFVANQNENHETPRQPTNPNANHREPLGEQRTTN